MEQDSDPAFSGMLIGADALEWLEARHVWSGRPERCACKVLLARHLRECDARRALKLTDDAEAGRADRDDMPSRPMLARLKLARADIDLSCAEFEHAEQGIADALCAFTDVGDAAGCGDAWALVRALCNRVGNTLRLAPPGGRVVVTVQDPGWVEVAVGEAGPGLPAQARATPQSTPGAGLASNGRLGLTIVARVARQRTRTNRRSFHAGRHDQPVAMGIVLVRLCRHAAEPRPAIARSAQPPTGAPLRHHP